jgi:putative NIF3 family GTP cyclohydrolase 1 type 2
MVNVIQILQRIREEKENDIDKQPGFIIGFDWLQQSKAKLKRITVASRLTRRVIATATKNNSKLIITLYPPEFLLCHTVQIDAVKRELLQILIEQNITVFSLGKEWLGNEKGGISYYLKLLGFSYSSPFFISDHHHKEQRPPLFGMLGEMEHNIPLIQLVELNNQTTNNPIHYLGQNQKSVQRVAFFPELLLEEEVRALANNNQIDAVIVGTIGYKALLTAQLYRLSLCILGQRVFENVMLRIIRRRIMEEGTIDTPEIITIPQAEISATFEK